MLLLSFLGRLLYCRPQDATAVAMEITHNKDPDVTAEANALNKVSEMDVSVETEVTEKTRLVDRSSQTEKDHLDEGYSDSNGTVDAGMETSKVVADLKSEKTGDDVPRTQDDAAQTTPDEGDGSHGNAQQTDTSAAAAAESKHTEENIQDSGDDTHGNAPKDTVAEVESKHTPTEENNNQDQQTINEQPEERQNNEAQGEKYETGIGWSN